MSTEQSSDTVPDAPSVAFQGEPGAFSEEAVRAAFGPAARPVGLRSFQEVARAVREGEADFGALPVENTLAGSVGAALDALLLADLEPVLEVVRPIRHCLLGVPGSDPGELRRVLSHPVALAQCLRFFDERPGVEAVAVHDTAGAARMVAGEGDPTVAALAARGAAERYGLAVLAEDLQDRSDNQTRFLIVRRPGGPPHPARGGSPRTLVVFETEDRPGALADVLLAFAREGVNLTRLASRPGRLPWSYRFVAELEGDLRSDEAARRVEDAASRSLSFDLRGPFRTLGSPGAGAAPGTQGAAGAGAREAGGDAGPDLDAALDRVREEIDRVDERIVQLLGDRLRLARDAQALRSRDGTGGIDPGREARVVRRAAESARRLGLPEEELRKVLWSIIGLCAPLRAGETPG